MKNPEIKLSPQQQLVANCLINNFGLTLPIIDDSLVPPPSSVAKLSGLPRARISEAYYMFRRPPLRLLPIPIPENSGKRAGISISEFKGGLWLAIGRYASFMTGKEIYLLLEDQLGQEEVQKRNFNKANINSVLTQHRVRHFLRERTPQERETTKLVRGEKEQVIRGRVRFWYEVMNLVEGQGLRNPDNRLIWMAIYDQTKDPEEGFNIIKKLLVERQKLVHVLGAIVIKGENKDSKAPEAPVIFNQSWLDPEYIARKIKEHAEVLDLKGVEAFEAVSPKRLLDRGVELPANLYQLIERIGTTTESILSKQLNQQEPLISNMDYIRYSMYYLIMLTRGLKLGANPQNISSEDLLYEIKRLLADEQTLSIMKSWRPIFENLVKNGKA